MNANASSFFDLSDFIASISSTCPSPPILFAIAATVMLFSILGLYTLFYPAILAALQPSLEPCRVEILHQAQGQSFNSQQTLSIIIPAYNEQDRLPKMLQAAVEYLTAASHKSKGSSQQQQNPSMQALGCTHVEWIIVSDGSTDETEHVFRNYVTAWANKHSSKQVSWTWKLLVLPRNAGKGAAVRTGMLHSNAAWRLMVDADGATDFGPGLQALVKQVSANDVVIGSRAHLQKTKTAKQRGILRQGLMHAFHFLCVVLVGATEIQDTQCGFKLFRGSAATKLFTSLHLRGWAFDTELIYMAKKLQMTIQEVDVPWREVEGSKLHTSNLNLALVAVAMLRDMVCVRLCYTLGLWRLRVRAPSTRKGVDASVPRRRRKED